MLAKCAYRTKLTRGFIGNFSKKALDLFPIRRNAQYLTVRSVQKERERESAECANISHAGWIIGYRTAEKFRKVPKSGRSMKKVITFDTIDLGVF